MPVDEWADVAPGQLKLVPRILCKQFFIVAPNRPHDALVNPMWILIRKFLPFVLRFLFLLSLVQLEHLFGRALDFHDANVFLRDNGLLKFFYLEIWIVTLFDRYELSEANFPPDLALTFGFQVG